MRFTPSFKERSCWKAPLSLTFTGRLLMFTDVPEVTPITLTAPASTPAPSSGDRTSRVRGKGVGGGLPEVLK